MTLCGTKVPLICGAQQQGRPCPLYICPRSGDQERTWKTGPGDLLCPIRGCPVVTRGVWRHVMSEHLSLMFSINFERRWLTNIHFQRYRGHMTMVLAQWLCHSETATGQELMNFLQHEVRLDHTCKIQNKDMAWYREVCRTMGWPAHQVYHLDQANSPVCVLNWRVIASILHFLTPEQQELAYLEEFDPKSPVDEELLFEMNARFWPSARPIQTGSQRRATPGEEGALMKAIQAQTSETGQSNCHQVAKMSQLGMPGKTAQSRESVIAILLYQGQRFMTSGATVHELKRLAKARFSLTRPFELSYEGISIVDSPELTLLGPRVELSVEEL